MNLLSLPNEILLEIAKHLQNQAWLNTFTRTNRFIFGVVNPYMHRYNADYQQHTALAFGACRGLENVVRRALAAKPGDINAKIGSTVPISEEPSHTPLCYALRYEQMRVIELLLDEYGADIEQHCCKSMTPLTWVARLGMPELTKLLVSKGANIHAEDGVGHIPILHAALSGNVECMAFLIQEGADVYQTAPGAAPGEAWSCLHFMVIRGKMEGVKLLVEHGVDIDMVWVRGMTPVRIALEFGHFDIASYLLEHGAKVPEDQDFFVSCATRGYVKGLRLALDKVVSIDDEDSEGYTALFEAVAHGHVEAVRVLLDRGASVIIDNEGSAIPMAAAHGHRRVLEMLLDHVDQSGCDRTMSHENAFQLAMRHRNWDCAKELLNKGAETNSKIDDELPISYAARLGEEEIVRVILTKGPDQIRPGDDPTLLFWVVKNLSIDLLRQLLELGLDPNAYSEALQQGLPSIRNRSRKGWLLPPLACAMSLHFYDKAELLIDHGADPRPFQRGRQHVTLVNVTRSIKYTFIAKMLDRGFNVNEKSDAGETPLSVAVTAGNAEVAELLLCHGAEPNIRIGSFPSVLSLAIAKGHVEVADVLRKHGAKETCEDMDVDDEDYLAGVVELLSSA
ncbi:ankyrin-2 [Aspergillus viridinutans]|uniref:Ankyrin-2 n=1 Tax=Aspergillus viridinutans TaxID=75553 RepID=A0A9P3C244_ASPVI|nr:ankyrin-2 [Aspergillus viridinutans]GIK06713.1 ankyrin-2 [Aspergillus viridinutans]